MKDFNKSDYSINKNSKNIVYISQKTGAKEITLKEFLASDPKLTEEDYEYWKNWSDDNYEQITRDNNRITKKTLSIENMNEVLSVISNTLEDDFEERESDIAIKSALNASLKALYSDKNYTEKMKSRFEKYYFKNLSTCEIASEERVNSKTVSESINSAVKKLSKYFYDILKVD